MSDAGRGNLYAARYLMHRGELWRVSRYAVVSPDEFVAQLGAAAVRTLVGGELPLKTARALTADRADRLTVVPLGGRAAPARVSCGAGQGAGGRRR